MRRRKPPVLRSGFEDRIKADLESRGASFKYEAKSFEVVVQRTIVKGSCTSCGSNKFDKRHDYTPDFFLDNGIIVEAKGRFTPDNRRLYAAFVEQYPDEDFRMLFQRDDRIRKGSDTRYSDWCKAHGIKFHIGKTIPEEWIDGTG